MGPCPPQENISSTRPISMLWNDNKCKYIFMLLKLKSARKGLQSVALNMYKLSMNHRKIYSSVMAGIICLCDVYPTDTGFTVGGCKHVKIYNTATLRRGPTWVKTSTISMKVNTPFAIPPQFHSLCLGHDVFGWHDYRPHAPDTCSHAQTWST